jgi:hypothetical protein
MTTQNPQIEIVTSYPGGTVIESGGTTTSKAIEMVGSGTPYALYVITDNGEMVASGEYNGSGRFINRFDNLQIREHLYELRANASLPPTSVWKVIVLSADMISIDSLKGLISGVEIGEGNTTDERLFALSGRARANATVDLYDNGVRVAGPIAVGGAGDWTYNTANQGPGLHSYTVRGLYDSGPESTPARTLTIASALTIDQSVMRLSGLMVRSHFAPNINGVDAIGNTEVRNASGGVKPYRFHTSNGLVASLDNSGKVTGVGNGTAVITVTDQQNASVQFTVVVSNIYDVKIYADGGGQWTHPDYLQSLARWGYHPLTAAFRAVMERCFHHPWFSWTAGPVYPHLNRAWMGPTAGVSQAESYDTYAKSIVMLNANVNLSYGIGFYMRPAAGMSSLGNDDLADEAGVVIAQPNGGMDALPGGGSLCD